MPKKINYTLTTEELTTIEEAIKSDPDLRLRQRAQIVRLLHLGHKHEEVSHLLSFSRSQVYWWHERWRQEGVEGLSDKPRSGRPTVETEALRQQIETLLATEPVELGYAFTVWTLPRLLAHLRQHHKIEMHFNTFRKMLLKMGYVYRRPKHDLKSLQDPEAKAAAADHLEQLKKKQMPANSNYSLWTKQR